MESKQEVYINIDTIEKPIIRFYPNESPEDENEEKRDAFFKHKNHFFVLTSAGKPVYTRYGNLI